MPLAGQLYLGVNDSVYAANEWEFKVIFSKLDLKIIFRLFDQLKIYDVMITVFQSLAFD